MVSTLISNDTTKLGRIICGGGIVVFPTETVYGIGADSTNFTACQKIYQIKNRPLDNPLIAHFASIEQIETYCELPELGHKLFAAFSPGPLTLVLRKKEKQIFTLGLDTLAVRIPGHTQARSLITEAKVPISAPSANPSGKPSFTREKDVIEFYDGKVDGILLASEPEIGIESTVLDLSKDFPVLLRPGQITLDALRVIIPDLTYERDSEPSLTIRSPGMKYRHYSPEAKVIVLNPSEFQKIWKETGSSLKTAFLGFHFESSRKIDKRVTDNRDYMKSLYSFFIDADKQNIDICYCEKPLSDGYYHSIMNRLSKAASKV